MKKKGSNKIVITDSFQAWAHKWGRIGTLIALLYMIAIPFVGWIIALVFAFGVNPNVNLKNFARAYFCSLIVACVFLFLVSVSGCSLLSAMM